MDEAKMEQIAAWIDAGVNAARRRDDAAIARIGDELRELAIGFPIPGIAISAGLAHCDQASFVATDRDSRDGRLSERLVARARPVHMRALRKSATPETTFPVRTDPSGLPRRQPHFPIVALAATELRLLLRRPGGLKQHCARGLNQLAGRLVVRDCSTVGFNESHRLPRRRAGHSGVIPWSPRASRALATADDRLPRVLDRLGNE
jgi:hypothetical protein